MTKQFRRLAMFAVVSVAVGAAALTSCGKDDEVINDDYYYQLKVKEVESENTVIEQYGRLISKALLNTEFRGELKKAVMEKFDGDYDVLAINLKPDSIQKYAVMAEILKNAYNENFMSEYGKTYDEFLANTFATIPNLQISVPVNCDEWNTSSYLPYVLPLHVDQKEGDGEMVQAFNGSGETFMFDMGEEPNVPVIVISISERVDKMLRFKNLVTCKLTPMDSVPFVPDSLIVNRIYARELELYWPDVTGELGYRIYRKSSSGDYTEIATTGANENLYIDENLTPGTRYHYRVRSYNENGNSPYTNIYSKHASYRNEGSSLKIKSIKFADRFALRDYEAWSKGSPELKFHIIAGNAYSDKSKTVYTSGVLEPSWRGTICGDDGWEVNYNLPSWYTDNMGDILTFYWVEEDSGTEIIVEVTGKVEATIGTNIKTSVGTSAKITIKDEDDVIGQNDVNFWDPLTKEYSIGEFSWVMEGSNN